MRKVGLALAATTCLTVVASIASAADLRPAYKAPPPMAPPAWSWTGFYIGAHIGSGWGTKEHETLVAGIGVFDGSHTVNGFIGGGQIGFNWQSGWAVWGVEADVSGSGIDGRGACALGVFNCRTRVDVFGTIAGRLGVSIDRALVYIKGGGAWVNDRYTASTVGGLSAELTDTRWGWMLGGGIEYAFGGAWSAKVEYNYMDFGTRNYVWATPVVFGTSTDIRQSLHAIKFGINYRFGGYGAPLYAAY
jgi:outer membrane immunogenic protein